MQIALRKLLCASCFKKQVASCVRPPADQEGIEPATRRFREQAREPRDNSRRPVRTTKVAKTSIFCTSTTSIPAEGCASTAEITKNHGFLQAHSALGSPPPAQSAGAEGSRAPKTSSLTVAQLRPPPAPRPGARPARSAAGVRQPAHIVQAPLPLLRLPALPKPVVEGPRLLQFSVALQQRLQVIARIRLAEPPEHVRLVAGFDGHHAFTLVRLRLWSTGHSGLPLQHAHLAPPPLVRSAPSFLIIRGQDITQTTKTTPEAGQRCRPGRSAGSACASWSCADNFLTQRTPLLPASLQRGPPVAAGL